ncbi:hypothetical protein MYAM1_001636 [Malassezia yamatoensis]|uniref:Uncharacterized protein n=1 Tax=Malassezia yamatoensis TaxID=253288 RepID=A0AAJ5YTF4_9BASI|nr:hypothetical protein MYAM1_001636 [Malassezia yamatoensis]
MATDQVLSTNAMERCELTKPLNPFVTAMDQSDWATGSSTRVNSHDTEKRLNGSSPGYSPRTPSPVLGGSANPSQSHSVATPGHLTFPPIGLGSIDQEKQLLRSMQEADEIDDPLDQENASLVADAMEQLKKLDQSTMEPREVSQTVRDKTYSQIRSLLDRLDQQQFSRARLKHIVHVTRLASLSLLSSLRISYSHMLHAERDINSRLEVELNGSKSQSRMLSDMVSRASLSQDEERRSHSHFKPETRSPEVNRKVSPPSPSVAERNKLQADKRYLRQRVQDAEAQVARLEAELQSLRPMLLRQQAEEANLASIETSSHIANPPRTPRRQREAMMGDAKSEHLLLAARMLRTLRQATRPSNMSSSPGSMVTDPSPNKSKPFSHPSDVPHTPRTHRTMYPATPQSARTRPQIVTDERSLRSSIEPNAPLSGIDELLYAAQSLRGSDLSTTAKSSQKSHRGIPNSDSDVYYDATSPIASSSPQQMYTSGPVSAPMFGSPKRRRVVLPQMNIDEDDPHFKPHYASHPPNASDAYTKSMPIEPLTALDLLADQAAAHESPDRPGTHRRSHSSSHASLQQPSWTPVATKTASASAVKPRATNNQSPEKRLPYVRWSTEEDTKLRRAIKEHGQRWEHVARAVGTRSYHQCRQRYLLMRRKEAAANGSASPTKVSGSSISRTPTKPSLQATLATDGTPFEDKPRKTAMDEEMGVSSSSSNSSAGARDLEARKPVPTLGQPQFHSPTRYDRAMPRSHVHHHSASSTPQFPPGRVGPVLYS